MTKIVTLGNALTDVLTRIDSEKTLSALGLPKGSMTLISAERFAEFSKLMEDPSTEIATGGSAANTALCVAHLSNLYPQKPVEVDFVGKMSFSDRFGQNFAATFRQAGVKLHAIEATDMASGVCTAFVLPDGERTMATFLGAAARMEADELTPEMFAGADIVHIEGYLVQNHELIEKAIRLAKESGCLVSLDLASYNVVNENHFFLKELAKKYVDIIFANEDESFAYTHLNPEESVAKMAEQCDIAIVKVGKRGSYVQQGSQRYHIGAITTACTDSTGAGDLYAGGFLHALSDGFDMRRCGEIGTIAAGRVVEIIGTKLSEDTWDEIRRICALYRGFMMKYTQN